MTKFTLAFLVIIMSACQGPKPKDSVPQFGAAIDISSPTLLHLMPYKPRSIQDNGKDIPKPKIVIIPNVLARFDKLDLLLQKVIMTWNSSLTRSPQDIDVDILAERETKSLASLYPQNVKFVYFTDITDPKSPECERIYSAYGRTSFDPDNSYKIVFCRAKVERDFGTGNHFKMVAEKILMHEVGHAFGLCDQYKNNEHGTWDSGAFNQNCNQLVRSVLPYWASIMSHDFLGDNIPVQLTSDDTIGINLISCLNENVVSPEMAAANRAWLNKRGKPLLQGDTVIQPARQEKSHNEAYTVRAAVNAIGTYNFIKGCIAN